MIILRLGLATFSLIMGLSARKLSRTTQLKKAVRALEYDLPLSDKPSIIGPVFLFRIPEEAVKDAFIAGYRVGALAF
ncbi:MAG TPA: hypothetical protein VMX96_00120 [Dehalococcoidia bacterium]|nr:hypothetical protein [Dehalococcoidia bacterium]